MLFVESYVIMERINTKLVEKVKINVSYIILQLRTQMNIDYCEMEHNNVGKK